MTTAITVRFARPVDDRAYEAYWLDLGKAIRNWATHGIDAEFETEWSFSVDVEDMPPLRDDLDSIAAEHGQSPVEITEEASQ